MASLSMRNFMEDVSKCSILLFAVSTSAFPALSLDTANVLARAASLVESEQASGALQKRQVPFDPDSQRVDVSAEHEWRAPDLAGGDQRGPCPRLNALANHGYLPRNGISSWEEIATVTNEVYGLGRDISSFLAVYGAIFDGSIVSLSPGYSIGGPASGADNILGGLGLRGTPQGLSGSHNKYDSDASSARGDLYTDGNDYKVNITRFNMLYDLQSNAPSPSSDLSVWSRHRRNMFCLSKNENPYFFYSPFAGVIGSTGGFTFPPRMMANKSTEHPDNGLLDNDILKSFFSISGPDDNLQYTYGWERIPENFYKRNPSHPYTASKFFQDFNMFVQETPEMVSIGGNTGTPNSYAALDLGDFTGGVYQSQNLLEGDNLKCFVFQSLLSAAPDILKGGYADVPGVMSTLTDQVNKSLGYATCPQIERLNEDQFAQYPGYQMNSGGSL